MEKHYREKEENSEYLKQKLERLEHENLLLKNEANVRFNDQGHLLNKSWPGNEIQIRGQITTEEEIGRAIHWAEGLMCRPSRCADT